MTSTQRREDYKLNKKARSSGERRPIALSSSPKADAARFSFFFWSSRIRDSILFSMTRRVTLIGRSIERRGESVMRTCETTTTTIFLHPISPTSCATEIERVYLRCPSRWQRSIACSSTAARKEKTEKRENHKIKSVSTSAIDEQLDAHGSTTDQAALPSRPRLD